MEREVDRELSEMLLRVTRHLGLEFGIVSEVRDGRYRIEHVWAIDGGIERGSEFPLGKTYCALTLAADDIVAFGQAKDTEYASHPCYSETGLESYIGAPVRARSTTTGTVNFTSRVARVRGYTEAERDLVRLFAHWVGKTVDRMDVTRKLRDAAGTTGQLHESLEAILQTSRDSILIQRQDRIVWINETAARFMRGTIRELRGRSLQELRGSSPERSASREPTQPSPIDRLSQPQSLAIRRLDGSIAWVEQLCVPAMWQGAPATFTILRDKTKERELQVLLLQSERLASIGTLAAGVAHELNNPLAYVMANLDVATEEVGALQAAVPRAPIGELVAALADAREGVLRARKIVRDLRSFSRVGEEARRTHDLHELLDVAICMSMNDIRHHAQLECNFRKAPLVEVDECRFIQVFVNLLLNASQAMADTSAKPKRITVATHTDSRGWAVVEIRDTGPGIPASLLPHIFEPFTTTKPVGVGTGLGLSVSQEIVTSLGGRVTAENTPDGALMRVELPPASEERVKGSAPDLPSRGPQGMNILVVDDDVMMGKALGRALGRDNQVVVCECGADALGMLGQSSNFDVILCDLMMPTIPGWEFYTRLRHEKPELAERVIFITGGSVGATASQFLQECSCPVVEKPFDLPALRTLVCQVAERSPRRVKPTQTPNSTSNVEAQEASSETTWVVN